MKLAKELENMNEKAGRMAFSCGVHYCFGGLVASGVVVVLTLPVALVLVLVVVLNCCEDFIKASGFCVS